MYSKWLREFKRKPNYAENFPKSLPTFCPSGFHANYPGEPSVLVIFFFFLILQTQSPSSSTGNLWIKKYTFSLFLPEYPRWSRIKSNLTCLSNVKSKTYITLVYHLSSANFRTLLIASLKDDDVFWVSHRNNTFSLEICGILTTPSTLRLHGLMIP